MGKVIRFLAPLAAGFVLLLLAGCASMDTMDEMSGMEEDKEMSGSASFHFVYPGQPN